MKKLQIASVLSVVLAFCANTQAQTSFEEGVFATLGGVELVSKPVDLGRDDYIATIVEARTTDPNASLVTYTNISITGAVHQVHGSISSALAPAGNAFEEAAGALYAAEWGALDTHLLLTEAQIAGGVFGVQESNDGSFGNAGFEPLPTTAAAVAGIGPLQNTAPTDAFFVQPEFQLSSIDFAYIVTPVGAGAVNMTLGLLGSGIVDAGTEGGAAFGYDGNPAVVVPQVIVPEPNAGLMAMMSVLGLLGLRRRK